MSFKEDWFEFTSDIKLDKVGYISAASPHPSRDGVPYWVFVLIQNGSRTLYVDGKALRVCAREFFLLPPNSEQRPMEVDQHTACYVHFYAHAKQVPMPTKIDASRICLPMHGYLPTEVDCFAHLCYLYDHAISPYASNAFLQAQVGSILSIVSLHCQRNPNPLPNGSAHHADAYLTFIKENACRSMRAADYETAFGLSYHQINLVFKRQFGLTVKQYHLHARMEQAAQMLLSGKSIGETAFVCGFEDYYFFIRCFTKVHGVSPNVYRKRYGV